MDEPIVKPHGAGYHPAVINKQSWPVILALVVGMVLLWAILAVEGVPLTELATPLVGVIMAAAQSEAHKASRR